MYRNEECRKRAEELVSKMTLEEKASQLRYDAPAIERLGIPAYNWWNEALHGVARAGTATSFPQAVGLAAMFDPDFMTKIADIIATEARAKYNEASRHGDYDIYKGLTFWTPNINIFRDPRWGRGHETYGEDPYLTEELGKAFIRGLQGEGEVMKVAACAKHFAVHSGPEDLRHEFNAVVSDKDLWETYLPAFEGCVKEAQVESVMGAYNRTNGEPCCGSFFLLKDILREKWGFSGHVVSDCWAIKDFHEHHMVTGSIDESAALAISAGCDLNCGNVYLILMRAYEKGLVTEEQITESAIRLFTTRYKLGMFEKTEYDTIPYEVVECKEHIEASLEAARKSCVLLKNNGILPLKKDKVQTIGVIGPNANSRLALKGNYYGTSSRYTTILEGIQKEAGEEIRILYSKGCALEDSRVEGLAQPDDRLSEAVTVAEHSDVVILCLGLDETIEGEERDEGNHVGSGDKKDLTLPAPQQRLLEVILQIKKPVVVCLMAGSALDLRVAQDKADGILFAWYPGAYGGKAVADILFGSCSPSGKLPVTFYKTLKDLPAFTDYSMQNRTYRYYEGETLYSFGYGLTYGNVNCKEVAVISKVQKEEPLLLKAVFVNESTVSTEEVVQVYVRNQDSSYAVTNVSLCGFQRIFLGAKEEKEVIFTIDPKALQTVNDKGERIYDGNQYTFYVGTCLPDQVSVSLTGNAPKEIMVTLDV